MINDDLLESLTAKLVNNNYKLTSQRRLILEVLVENNDKHYSAEELYDKVKEINPDVGLATIYRSLEILCELGIAYQLDFDNNYRRYELNLEEGKHHHHLICKKCGRIIEFNDDDLEGFENKLEDNYNFIIKEHRIKFYGICDDCQKEKGSEG